MENTVTVTSGTFYKNHMNLGNKTSEINENIYQNKENIGSPERQIVARTDVITSKYSEEDTGLKEIIGLYPEKELNTEGINNNRTKKIHSQEQSAQVVCSEINLVKENPPGTNSLLEYCRDSVKESRKKGFLTDSDSGEEPELTRKVKKTNLEQNKNGNIESLKIISKKPKSLTIVDSDSENESNNMSLGVVSNISPENEIIRIKPSNGTRATFINTDSESEDTTENTTSHNKNLNYSMEKSIHMSGYSENESNNFSRENLSVSLKGSVEIFNNGGKSDDADIRKDTEDAVTCTTNLKDKIVPGTETNIQKSRLALLCDSDSDEEPIHDMQSVAVAVSDDEIVEQSQHAEKIRPKTKGPWLSKESSRSLTKKSKSKNTTKNAKKMTPIEAAELRKEIQSESQRMIREKNVSLPYHKPKAHSLKEFLARRPRLAVAVSTDGPAPPSIAIKMSTEQLEIISKKLKEREKEVRKFYKSESESENDEDLDYVPSTTDINQSEEETKEATKISQDKENDTTSQEEENDSSNVLADITNSVDINHINDERHETESLVPEDVNMQKSGNLLNDFDDPRNIVQSDIGETIAETIPESEPMESENNDVFCTEAYTTNINNHNRVVEISPSANIDPTQSYDSQLDDENTEQISKVHDNLETSETDKEPSLRPFIFTDLDKEIENFGNSHNERNILNENSIDQLPSLPIKSKLEILKEKLANIKPKLSGRPDEVIDLNSGLAKPKEVIELMERFVKHATTSKKYSSKHKVKLSIVTVESGGDIHKETVAVNVDNDDEAAVQEEKPGAKLQRLREELQKKINQKNSEIWRQKAARGLKESGETNEGAEYTEDGEKDVLYDDEEEEMTDEENSEEELENDIEWLDKPLKKSAFLDQEAQVSDEETFSNKEGFEKDILHKEEEELEESEYEESDNGESNDGDSNMSNEPPPSAPSELEQENSTGKKRILKRIIKPDDDSDEEELFTDFISQKTMSNEQLDSTVTADEDDIPPHQTRQLETPMRQAVSQTKSISDFLTPISFITSIQNLTSATKSNKYGPVISPFRMPQDQLPNKEERLAIQQKKLFNDAEVMNSQGSLDLQITQTQESVSDLGQDNETVSLQGTRIENIDEPPNTQDLIGICSGEFTGVTQLEPSDDAIQLTDDGSQNSGIGTDQDMVISQLLDEEELENFKKKFESPINSVTQRSIHYDTQEVRGGGIIDSDDEDKEDCGLKKKRNQRRIQFSDDESSDEEKNDDEEEIDLQDNDEIDEEEIDNIGYDSEENEIDLNEIEKKEKIKMADFLDAEAELSDSEWGSEDEDEKDLDKLEFELGDTEKFDEEQVKADLEKIHMRRLLDDDAREVKLLQEVLLEDGEMHGTGRQRQFKWKNIDINEDQTDEKKDDDEIYLDEEESEEQWRKKRHEREMFLKEKQHKNQNQEFEDSDLLNHSQLLKIGQKVLKRSQSQNNSQNNTPVEKNNGVSDSPISKVPFSLLSKRGSFLSRGDQVLRRVAEYTKISADLSVNSSKTTKNFVFQSISASEVAIDFEEDKKRKASSETPKVLKKLRLDTNLSPAVKKKPSSERSKKLFNF